MTDGAAYEVRLRATAEAAGEAGIGAVIVAPSPDLAYLCGYDPMPMERPTLLVVRPDDQPAMLVPALERPLAAAAPAAGVIEMVPWIDGVDPYQIAAGLLPATGSVALADRTWAVHLLGLQVAVPGLRFTSAAPIVGLLRALKDHTEVDALRRAGAAADRTFTDIVRTRFEGRRELDVAADLADLLVQHGHEVADFTIVASGPNAASPHHEPGERVIASGDVVVMDFGGKLEGYFSDTTRTVVVGEPMPAHLRVHDAVHRAQRAATAVVGPGVPIQQVDRAAREVLTDAGLGDRFIHRTGHGIGLEVHEPPYAVEGDETVLRPGMCFSVEPGAYLPGEFGVRIEDIVTVTDDGVEELNRSPRGLTVVA